MQLLSQPTLIPAATVLGNTRLHQTVEAIADSSLPIMLMGRNRGDCAAVAHAIHERSARRHAQFILTRCGLDRASEIERRFFGSHDTSRAFVRSAERRTGQVLQAHRGTLYVEQIGRATPLMQERILQLITGGGYFDPATGIEFKPDIRIIATSACKLETCLREKRILPELAARLGMVVIDVPQYSGCAFDSPDPASFSSTVPRFAAIA